LAQSVPSVASVAKQESEIAGLGVKQAQAGLLPQSQFDAAYTYNSVLRGGSPLQSFVALNGVREYQFLLTASQEIDFSGRLRADVARARAERDAAGASAICSRRCAIPSRKRKVSKSARSYFSIRAKPHKPTW
jgi:outer membrane protein TolC